MLYEVITGEFFGFYNMLTKFAHVLGPVLIGITLILSDQRNNFV